ncbi:uncharacterized protein At4g17910 [Teleopsis dalmanni]|uniref:uncharacterized protein At4g17910 n=1 Tax=Teleopsis dalmanni TaxID=139649 RepID=UPI0018CE39B2|nr:uncharacterized protein At4g17910 [Teleopsis dalmanni]
MMETCQVDSSHLGNTCPLDFSCFLRASRLYCFNSTDSYLDYVDEQREMTYSFDTLWKISHIFWTIAPIVFWFGFARIITHLKTNNVDSNIKAVFIFEFLIITVPTILSVNVANEAVEYVVVVMTAGMLLLVWRTKCWQMAKMRVFEIGTRPCMLTLSRATTNFLTSICILAIDFKSFPSDFRKTRRYGVGLMDTGIGLFVFTMGSVSRRPKTNKDLVRMWGNVLPLLFLGLARTVVIMVIKYSQDEHEYGTHLNAFFTLGFTKLFGTLLSSVVNNDNLLLPLGCAVLIAHEVMLQNGVAEFVMDSNVHRISFLTSNREGVCAIPGFIGIYLVSMFLGKCLQSNKPLNYRQYMRKLKYMAVVALCLWIVLCPCVVIIGIARVTCNISYAIWTMAISLTITLFFTIMFDLVLNTIWPIHSPTSVQADTEHGKNDVGKMQTLQYRHELPPFVEALNQNGLLYFLLSNVLTGLVNIFLKPEHRTAIQGIGILMLYTGLSTGFVYILRSFGIKIA